MVGCSPRRDRATGEYLPTPRFDTLEQLGDYVERQPDLRILLLFTGYVEATPETLAELRVDRPGFYLVRMDLHRFLPLADCIQRCPLDAPDDYEIDPEMCAAPAEV